MLDWFKSYLTYNFHFVHFNNVSSVWTRVHHCLPQGSVLGSILFTLYMPPRKYNSETCLQFSMLCRWYTDVFVHETCRNFLLLYCGSCSRFPPVKGDFFLATVFTWRFSVKNLETILLQMVLYKQNGIELNWIKLNFLGVKLKTFNKFVKNAVAFSHVTNL